MYKAHISPTATYGNCYSTFKNVPYLESHKKGCNDYVLRCGMSASYEVEGREPKEHLEEKHEGLHLE